MDNEVGPNHKIIKTYRRTNLKNKSSGKMDQGVNKVSDKEVHKRVVVNEQCGSVLRREKREVSPSSLGGSGGERSRKKRKAIHDMGFEGVEGDLVFNQGKADEVEVSSKKKIGRRLVTKAMEEEMRRTGIEGLGED
ncbi:hypothetical protein Tco_0075513, partial [Tanacetum coccineum]